jgi:tRNA(Ile)-lysidine synthase
MAAPSPERVQRFRTDVEALTGGAPGRLGAAVSGGPDSLALLLLASAAYPGGVAAATVDHRLRPEAADEAAFVARICHGLGVPHKILSEDAPISGNVQSGARALRYRLLGRWAGEEGVQWLLTGHHLDDQAETLVMRLNRGAGLSGLAAIRARSRIGGLPVARPLLGWSRAELAAIVADADLAPVEDPSNRDEAFDRVRLRRHLLGAQWIDAGAWARSAVALAEAEEALEWTVERLIEERVRAAPGGVTLDPAGLPPELLRRLLLRLLAPTDAPRGDAVQRLLGTLAAAGTATLAGVKCAGGPLWRFETAPARRGPG